MQGTLFFKGCFHPMDAAQTIGQQNAAQQIHNGKRLPVYDIDNTDDQIGKADQPERFTDACKMRNAGIYVRKQVKRPELGFAAEIDPPTYSAPVSSTKLR